MPFLSRYREKGAWGISEVVSTPLSIAGDYAIFAGIMASPAAFLDDFRASTVTQDNLFKRLSRQGKRIALFGPLIRSAYGAYTDLGVYRPRAFRFSEYREEARDVFEQAYSFLKANPWDVAVVQFVSLDYVGHLETPLSENYRRALGMFDGYAEKLVGLVNDEDTVMITSEHGMDNRGFHTERKPSIVETPFVLAGGAVEKKGAYRILQIDWAPTLSVLAGVSPFYSPWALPALDLVKGSEDAKSSLWRESSRILTGAPSIAAWEPLHQERLHRLQGRVPAWAGWLFIVATLASAVLLAHSALPGEDGRRGSSGKTLSVSTGVLATALVTALAAHVGVPEKLSQLAPFSANFIMAHPVWVILFFCLVATIGRLSAWGFGKRKAAGRETALLFLFALVFAGAFTAVDPYHLLNWTILSIPVVGFALTGRPAWIVIFLCLWTGLAIRRLTFPNAYSAIDLPARWVLAGMMLAAAAAYLWHRLRHSRERLRAVLLHAASFVPGVLVVACPVSAEWKAFLLLCLLPFSWIAIRGQTEREAWLALWVTFFYLGTSSRLENTTHIVAFPLLLAAWSLARGASAVEKGILVGFFFWALYLLPGNAFDLKIQDLIDPYLMTSATDDRIALTVSVFAARYVLPAAVLAWGAREDSPVSGIPILATALLPVLFGIGVSFIKPIFTPTIGIPWEAVCRLTVLTIYASVLIGGFLLSSIFVRHSAPPSPTPDPPSPVPAGTR